MWYKHVMSPAPRFRIRRFAFAMFVMLELHGYRTDAVADEVCRKETVLYARRASTPLYCDIYSVSADDDADAGPVALMPIIIFIHGGGWMTGARFDIPPEMIAFSERGYLVVAIDYRKSRFEKFPACVHDVKAAVRFIRANARRFDGNPDRLALVGFAAGGHLAMLAGMGDQDLEGAAGDHEGVSSVPQAIVSFHGPTNLRTILVQPTPGGMGKHRPPVELLLGGSPETRIDVAKLASPVEHVRLRSPPLLMFHGDLDDQVPVAQALEMESAYKKRELIVDLVVAKGATHRSLQTFDQKRASAMQSFLDEHLRVRTPAAP